MPKSMDKKDTRKRSLNSSINIKPALNKNAAHNDEIEMSKKLAKKAKTTKTGLPRTTRCSNNSDDPRICGNGTLMPSLAELEKMFEDSDDEPAVVTEKHIETERCKTPQNSSCNTVKAKIMSPKTISKITDKLLDLIPKLPTEIISIDDDGPPNSVIPVKKRKKSDVPYIVGCKDRPQVIRKPKLGFGAGDANFGVSSETNGFDDENECPQKRKRRGKKINLSKSIFNAQTDEIVEMLKTSDKDDCSSNISTDSNKTLAYDYRKSPSRLRSFSPLPSTSKDNQTFLKNDKLFNESYEVNNESSDDEVMLVETPHKVITLDKLPLNSPMINVSDDDSEAVEFVMPKDLSCIKPANSPSDNEDMYSSIDFDIKYDNQVDCDIIDVDDVLAENQFILSKYKNKPCVDTITLVDSSEISHNIPANNSTSDTSDPKNIEGINLDHGSNKTLEIIDKPVTSNNIITKSDNSNSFSNTKIIEEILISFFRAYTSKNLPSNNKNALSSVDLNKTSIKRTLDAIMAALHKDNHQTNNDVVEINDGIINLNQNVTQQPITICDSIVDISTPRNERIMLFPEGFTVNDSVINISSSSERSSYGDSQVSLFDEFLRSRVVQNTSTPLHNSKRTWLLPKSAITRARSTRGRKSKATSRVSQINLTANTNVPVPPTPVATVTHIDTSPFASSALQPNSPRKTLGDCPICMENLSLGPIASTNCGHLFCLKCIQTAVKANGRKCPNCRKGFKGTGYHQIFI